MAEEGMSMMIVGRRVAGLSHILPPPFLSKADPTVVRQWMRRIRPVVVGAAAVSAPVGGRTCDVACFRGKGGGQVEVVMLGIGKG